MATNYIEGRNPFKLVEPSAWWLQLLADYDNQLVVMPSVKDCVYRLCRRASREGRMGLNAMRVHTHPDTVQMIQHGLIPVSSLMVEAINSDKVIRDLMARDLWRAGGRTAEGVVKIVDDIEYREELQRRKDSRQTYTDLDHRSGEAFRSMQARTGARSRPSPAPAPAPAGRVSLT